jgi:hypothetical protein
MIEVITPQMLQEAQTVIFKWFVQQNTKDLKKPITMLDTEISLDDNKFRLITHMSFYGRNELPSINMEEDEK